MSSATSRFILHTLMSNDQIYLKTYISRKPYSEYLSKNLPSSWEKGLSYFDQSLKNLDKTYKSKFKIFILPQRAEIVSIRLNNYNSFLSNKIIEICNKNKIDCYSPNLIPLSKIEESHFPVDGHLTKEGNKVLAKELAKWARDWD